MALAASFAYFYIRHTNLLVGLNITLNYYFNRISY